MKNKIVLTVVGDNMSVASSDKTTLPTSTRTTRQGKVVFERLRIPPPPPGYRPFLKKSLSGLFKHCYPFI